MKRLSSSALRMAAALVIFTMCFWGVSCRKESAALRLAGGQRIPNGIAIKTAGMNLRVQFYADDTVRIIKWPLNGSPDKNSLVVIQKDLPPLKLSIQEAPEAVILSSPKLSVKVSRTDGAVEYRAADSRVLLKEKGQAALTPITIQ